MLLHIPRPEVPVLPESTAATVLVALLQHGDNNQVAAHIPMLGTLNPKH